MTFPAMIRAAATAAMTRAAAAAALGTLSAAVATAETGAGLVGYALAEGGQSLVVMADLAQPGEVQTHALSTPLAALAWRPVTGELVGFSNGAVYTVDPATGTLNDLGATFMGDAAVADGAQAGLDFNNAIDAVRVVSTAGDNLVYFPAGFGDNDERAGSVRRFTALYYADGDVNAGTQPAVFANAYTNAINGQKASTTAQYALDSATDALVTLANNDGTLATVGPVTIGGAPADLSAMGGFDIVSAAEGEDDAFAVLQLEGAGTAGLYRLDLASGAATLIADLGMGGVSDFAVSRPR